MTLSDNMRGMSLMTAAMFCFATADAVIKSLSQTHPQGQIIWVTGALGALAFSLAVAASGRAPITRDLLAPAVLLRVAAEALGTVGIVMALSLVPLSVLIAIMQSVPLIVTLGAALFLRESVGWRRWTAILVGFAGVLIIIRPGTAAFTPDALWAVLGSVCLSVRDLSTRFVPGRATNLQLGAWGFMGLVPTGLLLSIAMGTGSVAYDLVSATQFAAVTLFTVFAILFITMSMRRGDVAVIAPFRYTRLLFGLLLAILWFGETPDMATWVGAAIVAGSGLYTFSRERKNATIAQKSNT